MSSLTHLLPATSVPASSTRLLTPTTQPIPLLDTLLAARYTHVHTLLVPLYYYLRARSLIEQPVSTLLYDLPVIIVLQSAFCVLCLPTAGTWVSGTDGGRIIEGSSGAKAKASSSRSASGSGGLRKKVGTTSTKGKNHGDGAGGSWRGRFMPAFFSLILTLTLPPLPLTLIALVLGAPLYPTTTLPHTLLLSLHVSVLAILPIFYTHGVSAAAWRDVSAAWLPFDESGVWGGSVGSLVGGWVGAVPMALDWDRDWQGWPCTVLWGCALGWALGRTLTGLLRLGVGKRINLSENESGSNGDDDRPENGRKVTEGKKTE